MRKDLARALSNFTLGSIGDRPDLRQRAVIDAQEITADLPEDAVEKWLAYALEYGADEAAKRKELKEALTEAKDEALRMRVHELTGAVHDGRKRLLPLLEEHDHGSDELEGLLISLVKELEGLALVLRDDFYVEDLT